MLLLEDMAMSNLYHTPVCIVDTMNLVCKLSPLVCIAGVFTMPDGYVNAHAKLPFSIVNNVNKSEPTSEGLVPTLII